MMEMFSPTRYRPFLGRARYLGDPGPGVLRVSVYDENGRPFPNVDLEMVLSEPTTAPEIRNVGPTGETIIDVRSLPIGGRVILTPKIPLDFMADPPFKEIEPEGELPTDVVFVVAKRQPEKDFVTPIVTWIAGGLATGLALWVITKLGSDI